MLTAKGGTKEGYYAMSLLQGTYRVRHGNIFGDCVQHINPTEKYCQFRTHTWAAGRKGRPLIIL